MERKTMNRLKAEHTRRIRSAARLLENGNSEGAKADMAWIDSYTRLTDSAEESNWPLLFGICLLFVISAFMLYYPLAVEISFEVETTNVNLLLSQNWSYEEEEHPLAGDEIFVNNIKEASGPGISEKASAEEESFRMALEEKGKEIRVDQLILLKNADLELNTRDNVLNLYVKNSPLAGDLSVWNADFMLRKNTGQDDKPIETYIESQDPELSESISFRTAKTVSVPVRFELISKNNWELRDFQVHEINFLEEYREGSAIFESAVHGGRVTLLEIGLKEKELRKGDNLILRGVKETRRLNISRSEKGMKVFFEGKVDDILAGPLEFETTLKPTIMKWLYEQKLLVVCIFWIVFFALKGRNILDAIMNSGIW